MDSQTLTLRNNLNEKIANTLKTKLYLESSNNKVCKIENYDDCIKQTNVILQYLSTKLPCNEKPVNISACNVFDLPNITFNTSSNTFYIKNINVDANQTKYINTGFIILHENFFENDFVLIPNIFVVDSNNKKIKPQPKILQNLYVKEANDTGFFSINFTSFEKLENVTIGVKLNANLIQKFTDSNVFKINENGEQEPVISLFKGKNSRNGDLVVNLNQYANFSNSKVIKSQDNKYFLHIDCIHKKDNIEITIHIELGTDFFILLSNRRREFKEENLLCTSGLYKLALNPKTNSIQSSPLKINIFGETKNKFYNTHAICKLTHSAKLLSQLINKETLFNNKIKFINGGCFTSDDSGVKTVLKALLKKFQTNEGEIIKYNNFYNTILKLQDLSKVDTGIIKEDKFIEENNMTTDIIELKNNESQIDSANENNGVSSSITTITDLEKDLNDENIDILNVHENNEQVENNCDSTQNVDLINSHDENTQNYDLTFNLDNTQNNDLTIDGKIETNNTSNDTSSNTLPDFKHNDDNKIDDKNLPDLNCNEKTNENDNKLLNPLNDDDDDIILSQFKVAESDNTNKRNLQDEGESLENELKKIKND